jgi:adenylate cyclase
MALRVLVVQQDMQNAKPLVRFFKERGDEVWSAWDLGQAEALAEQVKPHLLFIDLHYPNNSWLDFIRRVRRITEVKVVVTSRHPDVQREIQAKAQGVRVFLRQPYKTEWIQQALSRLEEKTIPRQSASAAALEAEAPRVRTPVRYKITLPYLVLSLVFALAVGYVVSRVLLETAQERFYNQLLSTRVQAADWMVGEEDRLLSSLRLIANSEGVAEYLLARDAEGLRTLVLPLALNTNEEAVELLDMQGGSVLSMRKTPGNYTFSTGGQDFQSLQFVQLVLQGVKDARGDKFAGLVEAPWGSYFYVSGPVFDKNGQQVGVVLVGKSLPTIAAQMKQQTLGDVTIYDFNGQPLVSTVFSAREAYAVASSQIYNLIAQQEQNSLIRTWTISKLEYTELLGVWEARGGMDMGLLGVSLTQTFLIRTSALTRVQIFLLIVASVLLVILVGVYLAGLITNPLQRLVSVSREVALGNLEVKVDVKGDDEVSVLAHSFNSMVAGLQEGSVYRDLLGRTVSPEVREQLRQTFGAGGLRLEGQEAIATVLMSDIRGFTTLSEKVDPAKIFEWLNEYFGVLVPIVVDHGGVVNKFDGDAMLAFFGILPRMTSPKNSARAAVETALEMFRAIEQLNQKRRQRGDPPMVTGIGIHTGVVIAGGLGSRDRLHYTIIGDTVNTTQRLEGLTRDVAEGNAVLLSINTVEALGEQAKNLRIEALGPHTIRGKQEPLFVYRLYPEESPKDPNLAL